MTFLRTLFFFLIFCFSYDISAQELPIFNQRLTNSFIYNPAHAGLDYGSISFIYKKNWNDAGGAPESNMLSVNYPFFNGSIGVGLNYFNDQVNIYTSNYGSAAFAYHIRWNKFQSLSFGLSGEYNTVKVDPSKISTMDEGDQVIINAMDENDINYDFSFGMNFNSKYFNIGGAYNRLSSSFLVEENKTFLQDYYSGYLTVNLPMANTRDLLQPMATYRKLGLGEGQVDGGLYYIFDDLFTIGGSYGNHGNWNLLAGLQISQFYVGYIYENFSGRANRELGNTNEIVLRFDFSVASKYKHRYASNYKKTKNAVSYRRKTLKRPPAGAKNPKKFKKKWRKRSKSGFNPNKRYNQKKLFTKKKKYKKRKDRWWKFW